MLIKVLFTLGIIIAVALIFRVKTQRSTPPQSTTTKATDSSSGVSSRFIVYTLLVLILSISSLVFMLHWSGQHQIVNIQITNNQGQVVNYQAYRKSIRGRRFTTLDGVAVTLGASDRIEMLEQN